MVKMNPDIKQKWVAALRSGEYPQTSGELRNENGFCCLGVLCDVHSKETGTRWVDENGYSSYMGYSDLLPATVAMWAGLATPEPIWAAVDVTVLEEPAHFTDLSSLNDGGKSFDTIAKIIEEQL